MNKGLTMLFFGYLIVFVDINLGYFDILFDPIGYIIVLLAITQLAKYELTFLKAKWLIVILLIFVVLNGFNPVYESSYIYLRPVLNTIFTVLHLFSFYYILISIKRIAESRNLLSFARRVERTWNFYLTINLFYLLCIPINLIIVDGIMEFINGVIVFTVIITHILILIIFYLSSKKFA